MNQSVELIRCKEIIEKLQSNLNSKTKEITNLRRMLRYYQNTADGAKKKGADKAVPKVLEQRIGDPSDEDEKNLDVILS